MLQEQVSYILLFGALMLSKNSKATLEREFTVSGFLKLGLKEKKTSLSIPAQQAFSVTHLFLIACEMSASVIRLLRYLLPDNPSTGFLSYIDTLRRR